MESRDPRAALDTVLCVVSKPDSLRWSVKRQSLCPIWREQRLRLGPTQAEHPCRALRHLSPTAGSQSHSCSAQSPGRLCPKTDGAEAPASVCLSHREEGTALCDPPPQAEDSALLRHELCVRVRYSNSIDPQTSRLLKDRRNLLSIPSTVLTLFRPRGGQKRNLDVPTHKGENLP